MARVSRLPAMILKQVGPPTAGLSCTWFRCSNNCFSRQRKVQAKKKPRWFDRRGFFVGAPNSLRAVCKGDANLRTGRSEEHTSELQSRENLVCRLLLEKKK